jgi:hypothetical protein
MICVDMARDGSVVDMHNSSDRPPGNKEFSLAVKHLRLFCIYIAREC